MNHNDVNENFHKYSKLEKFLRQIGYTGITDYTTEITSKNIENQGYNDELKDILGKLDGSLHGDYCTNISTMFLLRRCLDVLNVPFKMVHRRDGNYLRLVKPSHDLHDYIRFSQIVTDSSRTEPFNLDKFFNERAVVEYFENSPHSCLVKLPPPNTIHISNHITILKVKYTIDGYAYAELPKASDLIYNLKIDALSSENEVLGKNLAYDIVGFKPTEDQESGRIEANSLRNSIILHALQFVRVMLKVDVPLKTRNLCLTSTLGYLSHKDRHLIVQYNLPNTLLYTTNPVKLNKFIIIDNFTKEFPLSDFNDNIIGIRVEGNVKLSLTSNNKELLYSSVYDKDKNITFLTGINNSKPLLFNARKESIVLHTDKQSKITIIYGT